MGFGTMFAKVWLSFSRLAMSISAAAQAPIYSDPDRLVPFLPSERADTARAAAAERAAAGTGKPLSMFAEEEPSFWDVLDVINPLQHIPVVNTLYQELTGDKIGVGARLAGGTLFGGPIGLIASAVGCMIEEETGKDIGGHVLAMINGDEAAPPPAVAQAQPSSQPQPASQAETFAEAPIVTLPEPVAAAAPAAGRMMFTADGMVAPPPALAAAAQPAQPAEPAAVQQVAAATAAPHPVAPLGQAPSRFMPLPARNASLSPQPVPLVTVPVSNSGSRSNMPVTGRNAVTQSAGPSALAVQKAMAEQGLGGQVHPMLPSAGQTAAGSPPADWVQSMTKALDKYERAGSLAARPQPGTTLDLQ